MGNYNFRQDLVAGQESEKMILRLIKERTPGLISIYLDRTKSCDMHLLFDGMKETMIEVKTDMQSLETGNIALEVWCRGHESGIMTTESDYVIYVFEGKKYIFRTKTLKAYCRKNLHRAIQAGDPWTNNDFPRRNKCADIILIKKDDFIKMGRDMEKEKIFKFAIRK